jgi:hypothetical protein
MPHDTTRSTRDRAWGHLAIAIAASALALAGCAAAPSTAPDAPGVDARGLALAPADWDEAAAWQMELARACHGIEDPRGVCQNTSTRYLRGDDVRPFAATVAYLGSPDPLVRELASQALRDEAAVTRDPVFAPMIVAAARRERAGGPAEALGYLLGALHRPALAPPLREAIGAVLQGEGVETMRAALARVYLSGDRTEGAGASSTLRDIVLDADEPDAVREAALDGLAGHSFGVRPSQQECDTLYALPELDARWTWPVLEAGLSIEFKCPDEQIALLWSATEGRFDDELVGHLFAFLLDERRATAELRAMALERARSLAIRSDLPLTSRFSSLIAVAQVEPATAGPIAAELAKLAAADPGVDPDLAERIGFMAEALDFDAWGRIDDPEFVRTMNIHASQCLVWKRCRWWSDTRYFSVTAHAGPDQARRLLALLRSPNPRTRRFSAKILGGIRNLDDLDGYPELVADALTLAAAETHPEVAEELESVVEAAGYDLDDVSEPVRARWVAALEALLGPDVQPGLRAQAATVFAREKLDAARACGVWGELAVGGDPDASGAGLRNLASRCGVCDAQWDALVDGLVRAGLDAPHLNTLPDALESRALCLYRPGTAATPVVPAPDAFEAAVEAAALDPTIPAILRQDALVRFMKAGLLGAEAAARIAGAGDTRVHATARRLATYAAPAPPDPTSAGFLAPPNDPVIVELARRVLLECVWSGDGTPDPRCPALTRWSTHRADAAPTLLEFLWDADPRVRWLGANGLSARPRWHAGHAPRVAEALERLAREPHPRVASALARVVGRTWGGYPTLVGELERLARRARLPSARLGLLLGMLEADHDGAPAALARLMRDEPSADVRRVVAAAMLQRPHSEDHAARCALWLDLAGQDDPATRARGLEGATGLDCVLTATSGGDLTGQARSTWVTLAEDTAASPDLRQRALWALEYGRVMKTTWLASLGAGQGAVASAAAALARRRDVLGDADRGLGLADPAVDPIARDLLVRALRCAGYGGRRNPANCATYPELKWILGAESYRSQRSKWRERLPSDAAHATIAALLFDPDLRVRAVAFDLLDDRLDEGPETEAWLIELAREAAAAEPEKTYGMRRLLER